MLVPFFVLSADYADLITNVALRFFVICAICVICGLLFGYHRHMREWHIAGGRKLPIGERTLVMGILNVTPDSFSDGGEFFSLDNAMAHAEQMIAEGADIIDVGGESTRPGDAAILSAAEELERVLPVIQSLAKRFDVPVSIDTTKASVARAALDAGAAIVNDISALRFEPEIADEVAKSGAGLVLMHSRGTPGALHGLEPVADIIQEVTSSLHSSVEIAEKRGVKRESIVIDPGIGFGKSQEQNLELIAKLDQIVAAFPDFPLLIGTSRKSFLGRILADENGNPAPVEERLHASLATMTAAILKGAHIVRIHDLKASAETVRVVDAVNRKR
ncbi:MAG TPA: dihydropteroate synthase [Pyrinomonadaceae bacterium]|nr:dihydropteroate synthase [Pyrinomonadaceae bacterium]